MKIWTTCLTLVITTTGPVATHEGRAKTVTKHLLLDTTDSPPTTLIK